MSLSKSQIDRAEVIEGIQRGLASMERGEGRPVAEAFVELRRKYAIPLNA